MPTFTQLVSKVADRMNLTSATAITRIGDSINEAYKQVASTIGIQVIERKVATATTTIGNRSLVFGPTPIAVEKVLSVFNTAYTPPQVLVEVSFEELRDQVPGTDPAQRWALQLMGADNVTIFLDTSPGSAYTLSADVMANVGTLSGAMMPALPEDYHNVLLYWALAIELDKQEKYEFSARKLTQYENRLADLRYFIASSAYKTLYQGKTGAETSYASVPLV